MKAQPYMGISGIKTKQEVKEITKLFEKYNYPNTYTGMYGILTSNKRIANSQIKGKRSPKIDDIKNLILEVPKWAIPMIHYYNPKEKGFSQELNELMHESKCPNIQLNISWPDLKEVEFLKREHPKGVYTMQLPQRAIQGKRSYEIESQLKEYSHVADYILIDLSGGKGVSFEINRSRELIDIAKEALPNTKIGIAGGLNGENLYSKIQPLKEPTIMYDAESGLMNQNTLDMKKVELYLKEGLRLQ
jgi:phosphoribosylanthranilate isomerase